MSQDSARIAIAAHLHVLMRRKLGRVTDTEWMASNLAYAQEIIRICREQGDEELLSWSAKLDAAMLPLKPRPAKPVAPAHSLAGPVTESPSLWPESVIQAEAHRQRDQLVEKRYVGRLR